MCECVFLQIYCNAFIFSSNFGPVHMGSQVLGPKSLEANPCNLTRWEHGDVTWVLSPKYDVGPYMTSLLEVRLGICVKSLVKEKARPNSQHKSQEFLHKNKQDLTLMDKNQDILIFLETQKLGLCLHVETCWQEWDLGLGTWCELALNTVNDVVWRDPYTCE
jgi:hypothetical protein